METNPAALRIFLLGPARLEIDGEASQQPLAKKELWLLTLLALRQGRPVARDYLAGLLWPDGQVPGTNAATQSNRCGKKPYCPLLVSATICFTFCRVAKTLNGNNILRFIYCRDIVKHFYLYQVPESFFLQHPYLLPLYYQLLNLLFPVLFVLLH